MPDSAVAMQRAREMLRNWISIQSGLPPKEITDSTPLLGEEILDSFALISLTSLVEELVGEPLSEDQLNPSNFANLSTILRVFFSRS